MTASVRRAVRLEHRLTQPNASLADLDAAVTLALDHDLAALTVNPWLVKRAKRALGRSRVTLGTVVGYPAGSQILSVKALLNEVREPSDEQIARAVSGNLCRCGAYRNIMRAARLAEGRR